MHFFNRLHALLERIAIPHLIRAIVFLNALVFILVTINPKYVNALVLDRDRVLTGEVWRLVSWIFIPPTFSPLWLVFALMLLWTFGELLESAWGALRVNAFYLVGMLGCTIAAFLTGGGDPSFNTMLNLSIFWAAATLNPNLPLLIFFVIPARIKWLAWFSVLPVALQFLSGTGLSRVAILTTFANYFLFFGPAWILGRRQNLKMRRRRAKFVAAKQPPSATLHECATCHRTEISDPDLDFRVAADGHEYCTDHLAARTKSEV